jgi:hypothetical protein
MNVWQRIFGIVYGSIIGAVGVACFAAVAGGIWMMWGLMASDYAFLSVFASVGIVLFAGFGVASLALGWTLIRASALGELS